MVLLAGAGEDITVNEDHSVACTACHLRDERVVGSRGNGNRAEGLPLDHADFGSPDFKDSRFCAPCHQSDAGVSANGIPLTNTYAEWLASPFSARGVTCQNCHLPGGRYLFRGIHDPETAASGITVAARNEGAGVTLSLSSTGVGHKFPTYAVPRVRMQLSLWRDDGERRTRLAFDEHIIERMVRWVDGKWFEHFDTRLSPGETASVRLDWQPGAHYAEYAVLAEPDVFYLETLYEHNASASSDSLLDRLWDSARDRAVAGAYVLCEGQLRKEEEIGKTRRALTCYGMVE